MKIYCLFGFDIVYLYENVSTIWGNLPSPSPRY